MILLLSGPAASGKSTICEMLMEKYGFVPIKSSSYLRGLVDQSNREVTREVLQEIGDRLDVETDFNWLVTNVAIPQMEANQGCRHWFVDSVRKPEQVDRFLEAFPEQVFHVHITAPDKVLKVRLLDRSVASGNTAYEKAFAEHLTHPNEISARSLANFAPLVIDTSEIDAVTASETILEKVRELCPEK